MNKKFTTAISVSFLLFCTLLALFVSISGLLSVKDVSGLIFQLVFLPVTLFFCLKTFKLITNKRSFLLNNPLANRKKEVLVFVLLLVLISALTFAKLISSPANLQTDSEPPTLDQQETAAPPLADQTSEIAKESPAPQVTVKTKNADTIVNIRTRPTTAAGIVSETRLGEIFELIGQQDDWFEIRIDATQSGWIFKDYIDTKDEPKETSNE